MTAITVDDEAAMLEELNQAVQASADITELYSFSTITEALGWVEKHRTDIAFLDINMRGMGGIAMAERIQELQPECSIIFCTGYREYAVDAFALHVSGFLLKPITIEAVQREINYIKGKKNTQYPLKVQCFGGFEIFVHGKPFHEFKYSKTRELFAYLVNKNGVSASTNEIIAILWEDDSQSKKAYLRNLWADLNQTFQKLGLEKVLIKEHNSYAVDTDTFWCDLYEYEKGRLEITDFDKARYMEQYSWSEFWIGEIE